MTIETALEKVGRNIANAGRGPFEIAPGATSGDLLRASGDVERGRNHIITMAVYDELDYATVIPPGVLGGVGVPLVGLLRFGQGGASPITVEVDVKHGTSIVVPCSFLGLRIRNDAPTGAGPGPITEAQKTRKVAAWFDEGSMVKRGNATRTIELIETVATGGGLGTPVNVPPMATGVNLMVDLIENPSDKILEFLDGFGNIIAQVAAQQTQNSGYVSIPNHAAMVRFQNGQFTASERHSFVFELAF